MKSKFRRIEKVIYTRHGKRLAFLARHKNTKQAIEHFQVLYNAEEKKRKREEKKAK